jgi:hypothetical protein
VHDELSAELLALADRLRQVSDQGETDSILAPLRQLMAASDAVAAAWSGSIIGYHARVYYKDFVKVPPGARWLRPSVLTSARS